MQLPNNSSQINIVGFEPSDRTDSCTPQTFDRDIKILLKVERNPKALAKFIIYMVGVLLTPLSLLGICLSYCRCYNRLWRGRKILPRIHNLPKVFKIAMAAGVLFVWAALLIILGVLTALFSTFDVVSVKALLTYAAINGFFSIIVYVVWRQWMIGVYNLLLQTEEFGTARYATDADLVDYHNKPGIYIGGDYFLSHAGHVTTCASTRSGKGASLIISNLLGRGEYQGSWVVIDVKGENAAITGKFLEQSGKKVVYLNPWNILPDILKANGSFNPFDMFSDSTSEHLIDDVALLSEMIIPLQPDSENAFFINSARGVVLGLMLHLICRDGKKASLVDLWRMTRLSGDEWDKLLLEMFDSSHPVYADAIRSSAKEFAKMMEASETWSSICSNVIESTSFLRSGPVQKVFKSGLDPYSIADGNTVVFIIFPFTKLKSHSQVLRLMVTSLLQSVASKPNKKVTFLLDEASSLGYMSVIEQAMTGYAGFNITLWQVFQDLSQLKAIYGDRWETIWANSDVRQVFGARDLFTQKYVSDSMGTKTITKYKSDFLGNVVEVDTKGRLLCTPDEVREFSHDYMFIFTGENPIMVTPKLPYYLLDRFKKEGQNIYEPNPYIDGAR